jgi:hypothetical protein
MKTLVVSWGDFTVAGPPLTVTVCSCWITNEKCWRKEVRRSFVGICIARRWSYLHNQLGSYRSRSVQLQCGCKKHFGTYFKRGEIQSSIFQNVRSQELSYSIISGHQSSKRHCSVSQACLRFSLLQVDNTRRIFVTKKLNIFPEHNIDSGW